MQNKKLPSIIIIGILLLSLGCSFSGVSIKRTDVGEMQFDHQVVELGDADEVRVNLTLGAGELKVDNRADSLMEADFTYNIESWLPEVNYSVEDNKGRLTVRQPQTGEINFDGNIKNEWDLRFSSGVPIDMRIDCGAGDHDLDLAEIMLTGLDVKIGAGNVKINLTENPDLDKMDFDIGAGNVEIDLDGVWEQDVDVAIQGGVGRISLRLPKDVGVSVDVSKGIGNVDSSGLSKQGNTYTNAAYDESDTTLNIDIQAGVGQIELTVGP